MRKTALLAVTVALVGFGCAAGAPGTREGEGSNPFLEEQVSGKADTGYLNLAGLEIEVTLEADIRASSWYVHEAGPYLAQFATTYLRARQEFYLSILNEDTTAPDRVEWLVDGTWISAAEARSLPVEKLTHFRMQGVDAVVLNGYATRIAEGQVVTARVPLSPFTVMTDAADTCADADGHIELSQSTYWYLWNPDRSGCTAELQDMTLTVSKLLPKNPPSYPEYDRLWADGELTAVVLFGKLDDEGDIHDDYNWHAADRFVGWLEGAGFAEQQGAPLGRRFVKTAGERTETVDVYYPDLFYNVADYAHLANWQRAVSEHEVVMYLGHSVLGTGSAYEHVDYPDSYQVMFIGGCLGYEYYVRPTLAGKGGWDNVDAVSSIVENYYSEMNDAAGAFLAKLFFGFEHSGNASWQEIMAAVNNRLGHAHFGVSGARGNCFSPDGHSRCSEPPPASHTYESAAAVAIPDNDPAGAVSTIAVPDAFAAGTVSVTLDLSHTYVGDLVVTLSHGGVDAVLWNRSGGSQDDIHQTFVLEDFSGLDASGDWTLTVVDAAAVDVGTIDRWTLAL